MLPVASSIKTGNEDANFATPDGAYHFFTCAQQTLRCDAEAFRGSAILIAGNGDFNVKHYTGAFNAYQRTYVLIPETEYYGLSYFASMDKINSFKSGSSGSIIKYITKKDIESILIAVPPSSDTFSYGIINECIFECEKNSIQIEALQRLRDKLLPLLMNGQITIC
ncbi:MAG: restriction endonuclease subunit S [Muribaculaceae bacterium]|nr:restriction endonuclease subunit S [Muribaculaceae bacterium]